MIIISGLYLNILKLLKILKLSKKIILSIMQHKNTGKLQVPKKSTEVQYVSKWTWLLSTTSYTAANFKTQL